MPDLARFFKRHNIEPERILYVYHKDRKSVICVDPGDGLECTAPMQELLAFLF